MASGDWPGTSENVEKDSVDSELPQAISVCSVASQVDLDNSFDSDDEYSGSEDETDENDSEVSEEGSTASRGSYDSDEFAKGRKFSLNNKELKENLLKLHQGKGDLYRTQTSSWSRVKAKATAAYKVFKIKRWLLTDVNLVFDPLMRDKSTSRVAKSELLWPEDTISSSQGDEIDIKTRSVDGLLATTSKGKKKKENLMKLDEVLKDIDGPLSPYLPPDMSMDFVLDRQVIRAMRMLPQAICNPFYKFIFALLNAMLKSERKEKVLEVTFQNLFKKLVVCVTACMNEEARIDCDNTMDGVTLDKLKLKADMDKDIKTLTISSIPDLFIYERTRGTTSKRTIAVVEVKGKQGNFVLHSDDEDESEKGTPESLGMIEEEESEEELPIIERIIKSKLEHMKKLSRENRRYMRKFLPQLIGEMLCSNGTNALVNIKSGDPGYSFGIAVVGFDVYFVTLVASKQQGIKDAFRRPDVYYNVFITKPFNICVKRERRIVLKVLAAGFYVEPTVPFPSSDDSDPLSPLDLARLKIV